MNLPQFVASEYRVISRINNFFMYVFYVRYGVWHNVCEWDSELTKSKNIMFQEEWEDQKQHVYHINISETNTNAWLELYFFLNFRMYNSMNFSKYLLSFVAIFTLYLVYTRYLLNEKMVFFKFIKSFFFYLELW